MPGILQADMAFLHHLRLCLETKHMPEGACTCNLGILQKYTQSVLMAFCRDITFTPNISLMGRAMHQ